MAYRSGFGSVVTSSMVSTSLPGVAKIRVKIFNNGSTVITRVEVVSMKATADNRQIYMLKASYGGASNIAQITDLCIIDPPPAPPLEYGDTYPLSSTRGVWNSGDNYFVGDTVSYPGIGPSSSLYKCILDNTGVPIYVTSVWSDVNSWFNVVLDRAIPMPSGYSWKIVQLPATLNGQPPIQRVIDYKIQADNKNYYYFSNNDQWVVYHTFNEESYFGNKFYPTIGAVACYDENDSQIYPSDIIYCPKCISKGVFEGSKIIIKWSANQSGKVCFNPGISNDESQDQSRMIINIPKGSDWQYSSAAFKTALTSDQTSITRSTPIITTEPYMTVDAIDNGNIVQYALLNYEKQDSTPITYCAVLRLKSDKRFFKNLDEKIISNAVNTDILNVMVVGANSENELFSYGTANDWIGWYQQEQLRTGGYGGPEQLKNYYYIDQETYFPNPLIWKNLDIGLYSDNSNIDSSSDHPMFIDNIGYSYDNTGKYKYKFYFYLHGVGSKASSADNYFGSSFEFTYGPLIKDRIIEVQKNEKLRPMLKLSGVNGFVKIISKRQYFTPRPTQDGFIEAEYIVEFPCAFGSSQYRNNGNCCYYSDFTGRMKTSSDTGPDNTYYKTTQILFPKSMIKAGGFVQEKNERIQNFSEPDAFTTAILVESDFNISAYRRNNGGYDIDKNLLSKDYISYPSATVYRQVEPNALVLRQSSYGYWYYEVQVLSGENDQNMQIPVNIDMKLFVLYSNKKWKYNKNQFESYSGRENPSYTFEIDASTLLHDYSEKFSTIPSLPDLKRWFTAYCRGYAHMATAGYADRVLPYQSDSELNLEIWDQESVIGTKFTGRVTVPYYSGYVQQSIGGSIEWVSGDVFVAEDFTVGSTIIINSIQLTITQYISETEIYVNQTVASGVLYYENEPKKIKWLTGDNFSELEAGQVMEISDPFNYPNVISFTINTVESDTLIRVDEASDTLYEDVQYSYSAPYSGGNWRSITPSHHDDIVYMPSQYQNDLGVKFVGVQNGNVAVIAHPTYNFTNNIRLDVGSWFFISPYGNRYKIVQDLGPDYTLPYWCSRYKMDKDITETATRSAPLDFEAYYSDNYINDYLTYKFGSEKIIDSTTKIKKYFDLKEGSPNAFDRYIDSNGKMYFRVMIKKAAQYNIKKDSVNYDVLANGNPWDPAGVFDPSLVNKTEDVKVLGLDYFRVESV